MSIQNGTHSHEHHHAHNHGDMYHEHTSAEDSIKDPVCGMAVKNQSNYSFSFKNVMYYFCSNGCKEKFVISPEKYLDGILKDSPVSVPKAVTIYTCPMHPQIRQDHPGNCPICGMTLEPLLPELDEEENPELVDFQIRFWWTLPLTIIVTLLAMFGHKLNLFESHIQTWVELVLSVPIVLWAGWPFFFRGWQSVINRSC